jgi:hypothetical protein
MMDDCIFDCFSYTRRQIEDEIKEVESQSSIESHRKNGKVVNHGQKSTIPLRALLDSDIDGENWKDQRGIVMIDAN